MPKAAGKQEPSPSSIPGATFYRLKPPAKAGEVAAADFIVEDGRQFYIGHVDGAGAVLSLYGKDEDGEVPSYACFLRRFQNFDPKPNRRHAYVVVIRRTEEPPCWYAVAFGAGRYLLREDLIDVEAHRDVARRETIPREPGKAARLKQIRTKFPGTTTVTTEKRTTKPGSLSDLDVDIYTDVIDEVFGEPYDKEKFGTGLAGGQGLTIRRSLTLEDLPSQAALFEKSYQSAEQERDSLIEGMRTVKSQALIDRLDARLVEMFRDANNTDVGFALPYFATTDAAPTLRFTKMGRSQPYPDDITLATYRAALADSGKMGDVDLPYLKSARVDIGDERHPSFPIYRCLPATVELDRQTYVHDDRFWFSIPLDIREAINAEIDRIGFLDHVLPASPGDRITEEQYNTAQNAGDVLCLDRKVQRLFAQETGIEICDLLIFVEDRLTFVHVKRDFSSSSLSHLFNQGRVSALMLQEAAPRAQFLTHILDVIRRRRGRKPSWSQRVRRVLGVGNFIASSIRVAYAILGDWDGASASARLPFFSKVMLLRTARELRGREFDVRLCRLQMPGPSRNRP